MLEDQVQRVKLGYKTSSEVFTKSPDLDSIEGKIAFQKLESFEKNQDFLEALGYIGGIFVSFIRSPVRTYCALRGIMSEKDP